MYPVLFEFGIITVFSLWFCVALGFVVGSLLFVRLAKRNRVRFSFIADNSILLFAITLIVSRITFIVLNPDLYFYNFGLRNFFYLFAIWDKGLSFWGAFAAFAISIWFLGRGTKDVLLRVWDILVPSMLTGMLFGDLGAFLDGINYGKPTGLPWGVIYRSANVKYISAVHPTQIYGILYTIVIIAVLLFLLKKLRGTNPGVVAHIGVTAFAVCKFLEEFFRGDEAIKFLSLRVPQILAFWVAVISGYFLYKKLAGGKFLAMLSQRGSLKE